MQKLPLPFFKIIVSLTCLISQGDTFFTLLQFSKKWKKSALCDVTKCIATQ